MNISDMTIRIAADTAPLKQGLQEVQSHVGKLDGSMQNSFSGLGTSFSRLFTQVVKKDMDGLGRTLGAVVQSVEALLLRPFMNSLKQDALKNSGGLGQFVTGLFSGSFASGLTSLLGGGRAIGGNVGAGGSVLVGERGPELFTPFAGGAITPTNGLGQAGGAVHVHMTVITPDAGSFRASQGQIMAGAAGAMRRAHRNL